MNTTSKESARRAKLFWNGRSQAVRLPKEFRFEGDEVEIRREGESVILEPVVRHRFPPGYWTNIDELARGLELTVPQPLRAPLLDLDVDEDRA